MDVYFLPIELNNFEMIRLLLDFYKSEDIFYHWKDRLQIIQTIINFGDNVDFIQLLLEIKLELYKDVYLDLEQLFNYSIIKNRLNTSQYLLKLNKDLEENNRDNTNLSKIELKDISL